MKEHPILFSTSMITAILEGRKTQTRRVVKIPSGFKSVYGIGFSAFTPEGAWASVRGHDATPIPYESFIKIPYGDTGDRLWVKETFYAYGYWLNNENTGNKWRFIDITLQNHIAYRYEDNAPNEVKKRSHGGIGWYKRPSLFMPRIAARIILEIESIRVERLHDISREDAISEGVFYHQGKGYVIDYDCRYFDHHDPIKTFATLWSEVNSAESWLANPFVWVITFKKLEPCQ